MVRRKRNWHPNGYYHIIMRGNNRQNIFVDRTDMNEYHRVLSYAYPMYPFELHAYCIMTNHVHLLLRSPQVHLGTLMRCINKRYSDFYRSRHRYTGQIYENRYYSKEIPDPKGLLAVSAYIHRNPIETKQPMVERLQDYPYSSYPYYHYNRSSAFPYMNLHLLPELLPHGYPKTAAGYVKWMEQAGVQPVPE